jgi:hypothetical protein
MKTKTLLALISVVEMLLLVVVGILSNSLAELINLNAVFVLTVTIVIVLIMVWITFYKFHIAETDKVSIELPESKIRITQLGVKKFVWWMGYVPFALMLSLGAFHLSKELESGWLSWLPGIAVSGTLFSYPVFREQALIQGNKLLPLFIAWFLSLIYGGTGFFSLLNPSLFLPYILVFITISAITMTGLKYAYMFHIFETVFDPWFKKLPEK